MTDLDSLLRPASVAVIGASPDRGKIRGRLLRSVMACGYAGHILPINPSYGEIDGLRCYPSVAAVGAPIDLALIAIPPEAVEAELERCAAAGVRNAAIITSGFAEQGGESAGIQQRIGALARRTGMRILGPNAEGFYNEPLRLAATFSPTVERIDPDRPLLGTRRVGVVAQSGGIGFALFSHGQRLGFRVSQIVTTGNEADLTMSDVLGHMVEDAETDVVFLYCETVRDPAGFARAADRARILGKPILVVKVGASDAGSRAASSHTASVAGWSAAYDAFFAQHGVIQAADMEEALTIVATLLTQAPPPGRRVGVVTVSGGAGAWAADTLERHRLALPVPDEAVLAPIRPHIPAYAGLSNPLDIAGDGMRRGGMEASIAALAGSAEIDALLVTHSLGGDHVSVDLPRMRDAAAAAGKPLLFYSYVAVSETWRKALMAAGIPLAPSLPGAAGALSKLATYAERRKAEPPPPTRAALPAARAMLAGGAAALCEDEVKALLRLHGIEASAERLATDAEGAAAAAEALGFPVALKIQSPDILHKTEIGGLLLNLGDAASVRAGFATLTARAKERAPDAALRGVLVQRMAPRGVEVIIGAVHDATFGPLMMVGLGGVAVELFKDVAYRLAPVSREEAQRMLGELRSLPLLRGFRGGPPLDLEALSALIAEVSQIVASLGDEIAEFELNPVILHGDGQGLTIADALLARRGAREKVVAP